MDLRTTERIEAVTDVAAAMLFAGAAGFAALSAVESLSAALVSAAVAFLGAFMLLLAIGPRQPAFAIARFDLQGPSTEEFDELVLSELHRVAARVSDELVLDDVLAGAEENSRVVRLFDPAAMPADRDGFDRQFGGASAVPTPPDASQALLEALSKLRHSLR